VALDLSWDEVGRLPAVAVHRWTALLAPLRTRACGRSPRCPPRRRIGGTPPRARRDRRRRRRSAARRRRVGVARAESCGGAQDPTVTARPRGHRASLGQPPRPPGGDRPQRRPVGPSL
jgi:hypothetical protein